jgi:microcystin-dependent protein
MTFYFPDTGELLSLQRIVSTPHSIRLYTNDVIGALTPAQIEALDDTDFTEATFPGYAAGSLLLGDYSFVAGDPYVGTATQQDFVRSSTGTPETVFGYYATRNSTGSLYWFFHFASAIVVEFLNDTVSVIPSLQIDDVISTAAPTGTVEMFAGAAVSVPVNWLICDGAAVSRTTFAALFAVVGTTFGIGDGSTTFNVPDLRQRFPLGKAVSGTGSVLGGTGGAIDHVHDLDTATSGAQVYPDDATSDIFFRRKTLASYTLTHRSDVNVNATASGAATLGVGLTGDSDTENPPFLTVNYMIRT